MGGHNLRLTKPGKAPTPRQIAEWIGPESNAYWKRVQGLIEQNYPGIFSPDWLYGGQKHGWTLRYKKGKSFCTLIPEKNRFAVQIVFGAEERTGVETIRKTLSAQTQKNYDKAMTYHDGKWLLLMVDNDSVGRDIERLLFVKRKPKQKRDSG